jgi:hypothetical protein
MNAAKSKAHERSRLNGGLHSLAGHIQSLHDSTEKADYNSLAELFKSGLESLFSPSRRLSVDATQGAILVSFCILELGHSVLSIDGRLRLLNFGHQSFKGDV